MKKNKLLKAESGCCTLSTPEIEVLTQIFRAILKSGKAPTIKKLNIALRKSSPSISSVINKLEEKDLLFRRKKTKKILSIYPLSLLPTDHKVILEKSESLFAMCAVDALGIPNMFKENAKIVSKCEGCKQEIIIQIKNGMIISKSHPHILIWSPRKQESPQAKTCCPLVNFFCSERHLKEWGVKNPDLAKKGHSILLEKAYPRIKECWKSYGEIIGMR